MHALIDESFDRFARYRHLWDLRRALPRERLRILDVGDPNALAGRLFPDDSTVSIDVFADLPAGLRNHDHVIGSGLRLPFADASFDIVATHDTLEHLPAHKRNVFVDELLRVSRGPVLLAAPFDDAGVATCESIVNSFFVARTGGSLAPLDEHAEHGLPVFDDVVEHLRSAGVAFTTSADSGLYLWIALWMLKIHYLAENDILRATLVDRAYNEFVADLDSVGPFYRRVVVMRDPRDHPRDPVEGLPTADATELHTFAAAIALQLTKASDPSLPMSSLRRSLAQPGAASSTAARTAVNAIPVLLDAMLQLKVTGVIPVQETSTTGRTGELTGPTRPERSVPVAVVVVNLNGAQYLPDCLDSIAQQTYPRDLTQAIVVDNGSTDASLDLLRTQYGWVNVISLDSNMGFAKAVTIGVEAATDAECIALINNDMRADREWLTQLVAQYRPESGIVCVAGKILDWDGEHLDFAEGTINFYGMGGQVGFGAAIDDVYIEDGADLLFACGGSMLVNRSTYLNAGGFDPKFFAYFEDTDFGWRLRIMGFRTVLAANAKTFHHIHATSSRFAEHERLLLYERNALRSILKNYADESLRAALAPALMLAVRRAILRGSLDRGEFEFGRGLTPTMTVDRNVIAHLHAINDVIDDLPNLLVQRHEIQAARTVPDDVIVEQFRRPFLAVLGDEEYLSGQVATNDWFSVAPRFGRERGFRVVVVSSDDVDAHMASRTARLWEIAAAIASTTDVILAAPAMTMAPIPTNVTVRTYSTEFDLERLMRTGDVAIVQDRTLEQFPALLRSDSVLVVDLGELDLSDGFGFDAERDAAIDRVLDRGDMFVCSSERHRDYWIGRLSTRGRTDVTTSLGDPTLRSLIDVVPFGIPDRPLHHAGNCLKGVHPAIAHDDRVVLWLSDDDDSLDPGTAVDAFATVVTAIPNARLVFVVRPSTGARSSLAQARARAEELGIAGKYVVFADDDGYDNHDGALLEADVGVLSAFAGVNARFALRSHLLAYVRAGLPIVTSDTEVFADLVQQRGLGIVVPSGAPHELARALVTLLSDDNLREQLARRSTLTAQNLRWREVVAPIRAVVKTPWRWREWRTVGRMPAPATEDVRQLLDFTVARVDGLQSEIAALEAERRRLESEHRSVSIDLEQATGYVKALEASLAHYERRMSQFRKTPLYPLFTKAKQARQKWAQSPVVRAVLPRRERQA